MDDYVYLKEKERAAEHKQDAQNIIKYVLQIHLSSGDKSVLNHFVDQAIRELKGIGLFSRSRFNPSREASARYMHQFLGVNDAEKIMDIVFCYPQDQISRKAYESTKQYF